MSETPQRPHRRTGIAVLSAALALLAPPLHAQILDLEEYPRLDPAELPAADRDWLEREVRWIITDQEREAFLRLATANQREIFRREFWRQRDPTPGTAHNEYQVEHARRLTFATEQFSRGSPTPGWRTDRGRIYVLLGEPRSVISFPNTQLAYPVELWMYASDPALRLPPFFYVMFFKRSGFGDYRLYSPISDGPESLLNPAGISYAQQIMAVEQERAPLNRPGQFGDLRGTLLALDEVDREVGDAALSLIPASGAGMDMSPLRSEILLAQIDDLPRVVMPDAGWAYRIVTGVTEADVRFETLPVQAHAVALLDPDGVPFVHYAVRAPGSRLNLGSYEERHYVTLQISTSLRAGERMLAPATVESVEAALEESDARDLRQGTLTVLDRLTAVDGDATLGLLVENPVSREFGRFEIPLRIPAPSPSSLGSSRPFLVAEHQDLGADYDPFGSRTGFQLGRNFVLPALDGPLPAGGTLWVFHQLYVPVEVTEPIAARYVLEDEAGSIHAHKLSRLPLARRDRHGVLNQLSGVDLEGVDPGSYELVVDLEIPGWRPVRLPVQIVPPDRFRAPLVHAPARPPAADPTVLVERARQLRALGSTSAAIQAARRALDRDPDAAPALALLVELYQDSERLAELHALLVPRLVERPNDLELLTRLADVSARLGEHLDAIRYYERARLAGDRDDPAMLNALAAEYLAIDRPDEAVALLRRSLELVPEQPRIREMAERLESRS